MSNVIVTKDKLDILANAISVKSGEPVTMTLDEMVSAVDGIETGGGEPNLQSKSYTVDSAGTETIEADSGYDGLSSVSLTVPSATLDIDASYPEFYTENGTRKYKYYGYVSTDPGDGASKGWVAEGSYVSSTYYSNKAIPSNTTITPTTSSQTIGGYRYMMEGAVTVSAMPSGTAGTPTASKGTVSNHAVSVTPSVTNSTGYITGGTKTGTAVSVSASELVSGTYTVSASGTADVTNYASASVPAGTAGTPSASKGSVSNHSVTVTPSVTNSTGWITGSTKTGTGVSVSASELVSGTLSVSTNGQQDVTNYQYVDVSVSGGGGSSTASFDSTDTEPQSASSSISFTGLSGEPTSFAIFLDGSGLTPSATSQVDSVVFDGTSLHGQTITNTSNAQVTYDSAFTKSYSNGTLTVTSTNAVFATMVYVLDYSYGGSSANIQTANVQVGSGATSITFTGLEDEPDYWSCIFKSNFGTSSGYQRVIFVRKNSNNVYGHSMDSTTRDGTMWTSSYSNGSLTITSSGTNSGGYFHQPGYYQLTAVYETASPYEKVTKTYTPTTSQQTETITPSTGYDAIDRVNITVNAIPSTYVQPTSTIGATTYRASTSSQTINAGTYHSANATIAAVTQTNLSADNIKSGTTVTISNGQSNLWSVTGTYTGGGGGTVSVGTTTWTNTSNTTTSHQFTGLSGTPKFAMLRCTTQLTRSSNSSNYFIADIVWNGTSCSGNSYRRSNGAYTNKTSGYSASVSGTSITFSSTGTSTTDPGSFYNGTYELVYVY